VFDKELGGLTELVRETAPHVWQLLDWTSRGDVVVIEFQSTSTAGGRRIDRRGVDKFRLREGRIVEERVYADTAERAASPSPNRSFARPEAPAARRVASTSTETTKAAGLLRFGHPQPGRSP